MSSLRPNVANNRRDAGRPALGENEMTPGGECRGASGLIGWLGNTRATAAILLD